MDRIEQSEENTNPVQRSSTGCSKGYFSTEFSFLFVFIYFRLRTTCFLVRPTPASPPLSFHSRSTNERRNKTETMISFIY